MICNIKKSSSRLKRTVLLNQDISSYNSGTIDIKTVSDNWANLTLDNFALTLTSGVAGYSPSGSFTWRDAYLNISYDATTGILTYPQSIIGTSGGYCGLVYNIVLYEII